MRQVDIQNLADEVARETGLLSSWVLHHVQARGGRPCSRCDGTGFVGSGACFRCRGTGGKASHVSVMEALAWVRANVERVRSLGERRDQQAPEVDARRRAKALIAGARWKADHPDLWECLDSMLQCDFRDSLVRAVEEGRVTPKQEAALQEMVAGRRKVVLPGVGTQVEAVVRVTGARVWIDLKNRNVFRVDFVSEQGWKGRVETTDQAVVAAVQRRHSDRAEIRGTAVWCGEKYVVISGKVDFREIP